MQTYKTESATRIEISWTGKTEARALADAHTNVKLKLAAGYSINPTGSANQIIEGDNLDVLKALRAASFAPVRAIYIDPPYNTGNGFVYRDRRNHAAWLSMMLPRLMVARDLLADDGAIFVSIDDHEVDKLRLLMSEVFGEENFVGQITVQSNPRGRQADKHLATVHEYLVIYAKKHALCAFAGTALTDDQMREFDGTDQSGRKYRLLGLRQRGSASLREDRPAMYYPVYVDPRDGGISLEKSNEHQVAVYPKKSTGQAGRWMWGLERAKRSTDLLEAKLIARRNEWDIFVRDFLDDEDGTCRRRKPRTIWDDKELNYQNGKRELKQLLGEAPVDYPKPLGLLKKIIAMIVDQNAVFMDFFAGSGTLAQAVMESNIADGGNRSFVLIQLPETTSNPRFPTIADICRQRVTQATKRINDTHGTQFGFRYYTAP